MLKLDFTINYVIAEEEVVYPWINIVVF